MREKCGKGAGRRKDGNKEKSKQDKGGEASSGYSTLKGDEN